MIVKSFTNLKECRQLGDAFSNKSKAQPGLPCSCEPVYRRLLSVGTPTPEQPVSQCLFRDISGSSPHKQKQNEEQSLQDHSSPVFSSSRAHTRTRKRTASPQTDPAFLGTELQTWPHRPLSRSPLLLETPPSPVGGCITLQSRKNTETYLIKMCL